MKKWVLLIAAIIAFAPPLHAAEKKSDSDSKSRAGNRKKPGAPPAAEGKGGAIATSAVVQMSPIMAPYRGRSGIHYEVLTIRLELPDGPQQRTACNSIPLIHDRLVTYVYNANLTADDFVGERRDVLAKNLFDIATQFTGSGYYSKLELVGADAPELDPKSQTLSTQCR